MSQTEMKETAVPLIDKEGYPINCGWARFPCFVYDPSSLFTPRRRMLECDRYIIFSATHLVVFEVCDTGYLGYIGVQTFSFKDNTHTMQSFTLPFSMGCFEMPVSSEVGLVKAVYKKSLLNFIIMEGGARIIKADFPHFGHRRSLRGELVLLKPPGAESIVTHALWRRDARAFTCTCSSPWYSTEGVVQLGTSEIVFTKGNAWGIFNWERSVRPRVDAHFWATGCGMTGDRQISFSIGHCSADSSGGSENAFFLDGCLHKLDQATFMIPPNNWLALWHFTSSDNRLEMEFTPLDEVTDYDQIVFHVEKRRRVFGVFSGKVILDDGSECVFQHITGIAERRKIQF
jgi:hypothetical protein